MSITPPLWVFVALTVGVMALTWWSASGRDQ
jgi:hypothetical protein